jgi:HEAT repeat protein
MKSPEVPRPFGGARYRDATLDDVVADLAVAHRARAALWHLVLARGAATPALLHGLEHPDPAVRAGCAEVFDHAWREDARAPLTALLDDDDETVRFHAFHALTCDRCQNRAARLTRARTPAAGGAAGCPG